MFKIFMTVDDSFSRLTARMSVDDSWGGGELMSSCTIIDYHQLSLTLDILKIFLIVVGSFSRLTARTIVHDSQMVVRWEKEFANYHRLSCAN